MLPLATQADDKDHAQANAFGNAQWIGAITKADAKTPAGRHYSGSVLKESKAIWDKADSLSRRSIILRRSFRPYKAVKQAELRICGLGFYEATINGQKVNNLKKGLYIINGNKVMVK